MRVKPAMTAKGNKRSGVGVKGCVATSEAEAMEVATQRLLERTSALRYEPKRQPQAAGREMQRRVFSLRTLFFAEKKKVGEPN